MPEAVVIGEPEPRDARHARAPGGRGRAETGYRNFSRIRAAVRQSYDEIEDWIGEAFGEDRAALLAQLAAEGGDLDLAVAQLRRGMRYFAAGRVQDRRMFASMLFPLFEGDPHERSYLDAVSDVLRVAGGSVKPKTRHKLSFDLGVLYFTADKRGNMYCVVASEDFGMSTAFRFLEEMLGVYDGVDLPAALDGADESLWSEPHFRGDAFGVRSLAVEAWKRHSRPGDGFSYDPSADYGGPPTGRTE